MIAKIMRGSDTHGLLQYLYGPGRANEHADPHLVAAWRDLGVPDPGRVPDATTKELARRLDQFVAGNTARHVWHCAIRVAPQDRALTDEQWKLIARRIASAGGVAPAGDPDGCRWVAVRHDGEDSHHIHLVATLRRQNDQLPDIHNDALRLRDECRALEQELGLRETGRANNTSGRLPQRGETEKAQRRGADEPPRTTLARHVRAAAVAAANEVEFFAELRAADIELRLRHSADHSVAGYAVALADDLNEDGDPIYFGGAKLAPDLSLPQLRRRFASIGDAPAARHTGAGPWAELHACLEHALREVPGQSPGYRSATAAALGDALTAMARRTTGARAIALRQAAEAWEPSGRVPVPSLANPAAADLRRAARRLSRDGNGDGDTDTGVGTGADAGSNGDGPAPGPGDVRAATATADRLAAELGEWYRAQGWAPQVFGADLARQHLTQSPEPAGPA